MPDTEETVAPETSIEETTPPTAEEAFDSLFVEDAAVPEKEQERDESGKFVAKSEEAPEEESTEKAHSETSGTETEPELAVEAESEAKRLLRVKLDGVEEDMDLDEWYSDETKQGELRTVIEKGRMFDTVVARRERAAYASGVEQFAEEVRKQGFGIKTETDPYTNEQRIVILPPAGQATAKPGVASETAQPANLDEQIAELEAKIEAGEGYGADFVKLARLSRQRIADMEQRYKSDAQSREKAAQEAAQKRNVTEFQNRIGGLIESHAKAFGTQAGDVGRDAWLMAVGRAQSGAKSIEEVEEAVRHFFNRLDKFRPPAAPAAKAPEAQVAKPEAKKAPPAVGKGKATGVTEDRWGQFKDLDEMPASVFAEMTFE